ncbi:glycosyl transferase, WecB/TagA/CpsF family [Syntrophobotulus glycolicus DSM 8271]|uniref:N-acetylglucosaminyldiphosphoundecaprenol N-acetyl-beta-D-mannosaminyltransferase n=1 Tax=Syntrophobotulus glycolicus (strain DSM 8271 / FlGlyR) TaxID=645991 RepID=F0T299_SYNGF|nr:WecB/TagA/CpsF family glycosyltransferase [Syntrophobotulus glycolicus]ADY57527.1 glycosyl transferase, WecB/TagA/CpsF family [Syntrophobotulus glycolicus DSM 8271]
MDEVNILGVRIDGFRMSEVLTLVCQTIKSKKHLRIVTANPEILFRAEKNEELRNIVNGADLILADGVGIIWAAKVLEGVRLERLTGIDLATEIMAAADVEGRKVFLLGSKPGVAEEAASFLSKKYEKVQFMTHHGYFGKDEEEEIIGRIRNFSPDILLVGLGAPKQEQWIYNHPDLAYVSMGVGGSFDVLSGQVKRAPLWVRRLGLEWLYRLVSEPSRFKRQSILPVFVFAILRQKVKKNRPRQR